MFHLLLGVLKWERIKRERPWLWLLLVMAGLLLFYYKQRKADDAHWQNYHSRYEQIDNEAEQNSKQRDQMNQMLRQAIAGSHHAVERKETTP